MEIPFGKIVIYALTFLGYVYSGYGSGLLSNLRDAVLSAETVFGDVFQNVIYVAKRFRNLHEIFDAAVDEDCIFKCPLNAVPRPDRNHKPSANGCGALGMKISSDYLPVGEMTKCCDLHDICYDTCNSSKEVCDVEFKKCLYKHCETYDKSVGGMSLVKACKGAAKMLFTGTLTLGCKAYKEAQGKACYCPPVKKNKAPPAYGWKDNRNKKYTRGDEL